MKAHHFLVQGLWQIADVLRQHAPSEKATECVAALFFLKRMTDLAAVGQLEKLVSVRSAQLSAHYRTFSWNGFAPVDRAGPAFLEELERIEQAVPDLLGLSTETRLAQVFAARGNMDAEFRKIFLLLDAIPTANLSAKEAAAIFQHLLDVSVDRTATLTPPSVRKLLVGLVAPQSGETIYDPVCGYGSLLCEAAASVKSVGLTISLTGQDSNRGALVLARMHTQLLGHHALLIAGNTLVTFPTQKAFDVIVANPPFGLRLKADVIASDNFRRYAPVVPSSSELAFVLHAVHSLSPKGRAAILVPNGMLFRSGNDQLVRQSLVESSRIEAVLSLPPYLMHGTAIPASVLILRGESIAMRRQPITFIDLTSFAEGPTTRRRLTDDAVTESAAILRSGMPKHGISAIVPEGMVAANEFNLSVTRYVRVRHEIEPRSFQEELREFHAAIGRRDEAESTAQRLLTVATESGLRSKSAERKGRQS